MNEVSRTFTKLYTSCSIYLLVFIFKFIMLMSLCFKIYTSKCSLSVLNKSFKQLCFSEHHMHIYNSYVLFTRQQRQPCTNLKHQTRFFHLKPDLHTSFVNFPCFFPSPHLTEYVGNIIDAETKSVRLNCNDFAM